MTIDLNQPFHGRSAVRAGLVTPRGLRGPRFRRLLQGIYIAADAEVTFLVRSRAAAMLLGWRGVLGGFSAAELLGASCAPLDAPAEVIAFWTGMRPRPELKVRFDNLLLEEIIDVNGYAVTSPVRTAYDLARRLSLVEAVVAVDALTHAHDFPPTDILEVSRRHRGLRGSARLPQVVTLANPLSQSPMETRIRVALHFGGLPEPVPQHPVGPYWLDLAYPDHLLAIEYDGREHLDPERAMRDLKRAAYLGSRGWEVLRFNASTVFNHPRTIAATVRNRLRDRSGLALIAPAASINASSPR